MVIHYGVALLSGRWAMVLALLLATVSCILQIGYGASAILLSAHAQDHRAAWLHPVSGVARSFVPPTIVNHELLQATRPNEAEILEGRGFSPADFAHLINQKSETGEPMYVKWWFTFNAVVANALSFLSVLFLFTVDFIKAWEGIMEGLVCCSYCKRSVTHPVMDKFSLARYHLTRIHAMYNLWAEGLSHVVTLPFLCPVPCTPTVTVGYLGTLGLTISFIKVFEGILHKIALSVKEARAQGRRAWQVAEGQGDVNSEVSTTTTRREQVVRLTQISLATARASQSGVQFVKDFAPYIKENAMLGISLTVSFATFPVQPYGMAIGLVGLVLKDVMPKVDAELADKIPQEFLEADAIANDEDFAYWLSSKKLEVFGWMIKVRMMSDRMGDLRGLVGKIKMVVKQVVGQDASLGLCGDTSIQVLDVMRIVDPLLDGLQTSAVDFAQDLNLLSDSLRRYSDMGSDADQKELNDLSMTIRRLMPKRLTSNFIKKVPCDMLGHLLDMMETSKVAGARELMLEEPNTGTEELQRQSWLKKHPQSLLASNGNYKPLPKDLESFS